MMSCSFKFLLDFNWLDKGSYLLVLKSHPFKRNVDNSAYHNALYYSLCRMLYILSSSILEDSRSAFHLFFSL